MCMHAVGSHNVVKVGRVEYRFKLIATSLASKCHFDCYRTRCKMCDDTIKVAMMPKASRVKLNKVSKEYDEMCVQSIPSMNGGHIATTRLPYVETEENEKSPSDATEKGGRNIDCSSPKFGSESVEAFFRITFRQKIHCGRDGNRPECLSQEREPWERIPDSGDERWIRAVRFGVGQTRCFDTSLEEGHG